MTMADPAPCCATMCGFAMVKPEGCDTVLTRPLSSPPTVTHAIPFFRKTYTTPATARPTAMIPPTTPPMMAPVDDDVLDEDEPEEGAVVTRSAGKRLAEKLEAEIPVDWARAWMKALDTADEGLESWLPREDDAAR